uniref:Ig-like domain-containing protein n=1 Tax=Myripristis murdjan TaxID=586833 RepID=A0A667ZHX9_9TELE
MASPIYLHLLALGHLILVPSEKSVLEGEDTLLKCHSMTETAATEPVRWEKDGRLVHQEDFASRNTTSSSADFQGRVSVSAGGYRDGDLSLVLRGARKTDQGVYRCFHGGKKGNPAAVNLTVHPGGTWTVPGYYIIIAALLCAVSVPLGALAGWFLKSRRNARRNAGEGNDREMQPLASQTNGQCSNGAPAGGHEFEAGLLSLAPCPADQFCQKSPTASLNREANIMLK